MRYRLTLKEKHGTRKNCIYTEANSEAEAKEFFEKKFNRFNELVRITKCKSK